MSTKYKPTIWAKRYRTMPRHQRDVINKKTNEIFRTKTGVTRKLDPKHDGHLCKVWLELRDEVMRSSAALREAANHRPTQSTPHTISERLNDIPFIGPVYQPVVDVAADFTNDVLDLAQAPWLAIARAELAKGVKEFSDPERHNPEIMKYFTVCDNLNETANQKKWTQDVGPKKIKWCAAFVNWCLDQVGIRGTRHTWALNFAKWGTPIDEPKIGAICVQQTDTWRHVSFIDEVNGELKVLGGNQKAANGRGGSNQVSYRPLWQKIVVEYVWPN